MFALHVGNHCYQICLQTNETIYLKLTKLASLTDILISFIYAYFIINKDLLYPKRKLIRHLTKKVVNSSFYKLKFCCCADIVIFLFIIFILASKFALFIICSRCHPYCSDLKVYIFLGSDIIHINVKLMSKKSSSSKSLSSYETHFVRLLTDDHK